MVLEGEMTKEEIDLEVDVIESLEKKRRDKKTK